MAFLTPHLPINNCGICEKIDFVAQSGVKMTDWSVGIVVRLLIIMVLLNLLPGAGLLMQKKVLPKKDRVLRIAAELFAEKGFHEVKLDDVAKSADVAKGTIYTYFASKDELFIQCILHDSPVYEERFKQTIASTPDFSRCLKKLIALQYEMVKEKGPLVKQIMQLGPQLKLGDKEFKSLLDQFETGVKLLASFFQSGIDRRILHDNLTAGQMAIMFQQIFDLNVLFNFYREPELRQTDVFDFLMRTFGNNRSC